MTSLSCLTTCMVSAAEARSSDPFCLWDPYPSRTVPSLSSSRGEVRALPTVNLPLLCSGPSPVLLGWLHFFSFLNFIYLGHVYTQYGLKLMTPRPRVSCFPTEPARIPCSFCFVYQRKALLCQSSQKHGGNPFHPFKATVLGTGVTRDYKNPCPPKTCILEEEDRQQTISPQI